MFKILSKYIYESKYLKYNVWRLGVLYDIYIYICVPLGTKGLILGIQLY